MSGEAHVKPHYISTVDNIETAFRWADEGIAVAIIPDSLIFHGGFKNHLNYYKLDLAFSLFTLSVTISNSIPG